MVERWQRSEEGRDGDGRHVSNGSSGEMEEMGSSRDEVEGEVT